MSYLNLRFSLGVLITLCECETLASVCVFSKPRFSLVVLLNLSLCETLASVWVFSKPSLVGLLN